MRAAVRLAAEFRPQDLLQEPTAQAEADLATELRVEYGRTAAGSPLGAVVLRAREPARRFGLVSRTVALPAITQARLAVAIGTRLLRRDSRPRWRVRLAVAGERWAGLRPGDWVSASHPLLPCSGQAGALLEAHLDPEAGTVELLCEVMAGPAPTIELRQVAGAWVGRSVVSVVVEEFRAGDARATAIGADGRPLVGAEVTVDGTQTVRTDSAGRFQVFNIGRGSHALAVAATGYPLTTVYVVV